MQILKYDQFISEPVNESAKDEIFRNINKNEELLINSIYQNKNFCVKTNNPEIISFAIEELAKRYNIEVVKVDIDAVDKMENGINEESEFVTEINKNKGKKHLVLFVGIDEFPENFNNGLMPFAKDYKIGEKKIDNIFVGAICKDEKNVPNPLIARLGGNMIEM